MAINSENTAIGIIGGRGKMGKYFARLFQDAGYKVVVSDHKTPLSNKELVQKTNVIFISVPITKTQEVIRSIAKHVNKESVIVDLTSIKEMPVKEMLKSKAQVIGLHPMFGPTNPIQGQTIIAHPARGKTYYTWLKKFLEDRGANVLQMNPKEHDKIMGVVQGMVHFADVAFGHALKELKIPAKKYLQFASPASELKIAFVGRILSHDPNLYASIQQENPEAFKAMKQYTRSIEKLLEIDKKKDQQAFKKYFESAGAALKTYKKTAKDDTNYLIHAILQRRQRAQEIQESKHTPKTGDIAVLGPENTFSDLAAKQIAQDGETVLYVASIHQAFEAVEKGNVKKAVVPIENMLNGSVRETFDELFLCDVHIASKVNQPILHALVALPGTKKSDIDTIKSHPQAIQQCSAFLQKNYPNARRVPTTSTIQAYKTIAGENDRGGAAIIPLEVAKKLSCTILAKNIGDRKDNQTTFAIIQKGKAAIPQMSGPTETAITFAFSKNQPGSLNAVFQEFAKANINLSRIESRPSKKLFGEYVFFLDFEGSPANAKAQRALTNIKKKVKTLKILGTYIKSH